ncbi:unnamed protein product [Amoebophrya sp. A25]|nr:unnamed protein product [Amoebophrya sp. A25]|eukprot:GSA25T00010746001.1
MLSALFGGGSKSKASAPSSPKAKANGVANGVESLKVTKEADPVVEEAKKTPKNTEAPAKKDRRPLDTSGPRKVEEWEKPYLEKLIGTLLPPRVPSLAKVGQLGFEADTFAFAKGGKVTEFVLLKSGEELEKLEDASLDGFVFDASTFDAAQTLTTLKTKLKPGCSVTFCNLRRHGELKREVTKWDILWKKREVPALQKVLGYIVRSHNIARVDPPETCKYYDEKEALIPRLEKIRLQQASFTTISKLNPGMDGKTVNLKVKVVSVSEKEAIIGDASACCVYEIPTTNADCVKAGESLELRNATVRMTREGFLHLITNQWGKVSTSETASEEEVKEDNNISKDKYVFKAETQKKKGSGKKGKKGENKKEDAKTEDAEAAEGTSKRRRSRKGRGKKGKAAAEKDGVEKNSSTSSTKAGDSSAPEKESRRARKARGKAENAEKKAAAESAEKEPEEKRPSRREREKKKDKAKKEAAAEKGKKSRDDSSPPRGRTKDGKKGTKGKKGKGRRDSDSSSIGKGGKKGKSAKKGDGKKGKKGARFSSEDDKGKGKGKKGKRRDSSRLSESSVESYYHGRKGKKGKGKKGKAFDDSDSDDSLYGKKGKSKSKGKKGKKMGYHSDSDSDDEYGKGKGKKGYASKDSDYGKGGEKGSSSSPGYLSYGGGKSSGGRYGGKGGYESSDDEGYGGRKGGGYGGGKSSVLDGKKGPSGKPKGASIDSYSSGKKGSGKKGSYGYY